METHPVCSVPKLPRYVRALRRKPSGPRPRLRLHATNQHKIFSTVFREQMAKHGDTIPSLVAAVAPTLKGRRKVGNCRRVIKLWRLGLALPTKPESYALLQKVEWRYGLPEGYFAALAKKPGNAALQFLNQASWGDRPAIKWHLPRDFEKRPEGQRKEIEQWIRQNVLPGSTDYGRYQGTLSQNRYAIVFPTLPKALGGRAGRGGFRRTRHAMGLTGGYGTVNAPRRLAQEIQNFLLFMTSPLPPIGYSRHRPWTAYVAEMHARRFGEVFGALSAAPHSAAGGFGVDLTALTLGLFAFPKVWDWFLKWRAARRGGFHATSERSLMYSVKMMVRPITGWLRQHPELAKAVRPIKGLVSARDIKSARRDWQAQCDIAFRYTSEAARQLHWVCKPVRDPFLAIMPVLDADEPLRLYRKIGDEILRRMPDEKTHARESAVAVRNYLLFRFAVHLGFRQRNLRELMFAIKGQSERSSHQLQQLRRGEIRWDEKGGRWVVFVPAAAFKNGGSSYFRGKPYHQALPKVGDLYRWIDVYVERHRPLLLGDFADPGTFFIKEMRAGVRSAEFELYSFYDSWTQMIQRYGIFNPYTRKGAVKGLLPHGPHCVRDILATHILKKTGSYELAGFAIQDTVESTMRHYARFLPHEKAARVAELVNEIWQ